MQKSVSYTFDIVCVVDLSAQTKRFLTVLVVININGRLTHWFISCVCVCVCVLLLLYFYLYGFTAAKFTQRIIQIQTQTHTLTEVAQ